MSRPLGVPFWDRVDKSGECWIWTGAKDGKGYGRLWHEGKLQQAHRVAWQIENGPIPNSLLACHHCDNPPCVRPDHLFLGTVKDNAEDMVSKGRNRSGHFVGQDHPRAILTEDQVMAIRALEGSMSRPKIAAQFGVAAITVTRIHRRTLWGHL